MEHLESFIILTNIKGLLFCVKRGGIYIMSYPYTTDLFFGSEKSSCDGVAHLSFGKPVIVGDKVRFISDPYEVSNDYTYDYDNDAFTFNTTKNAYTVLEIDKAVYDNLTDKPEFYGLEYRMFPYPPYSLFEDSSLETPVEDDSSLVPNTTYYYDENEYNDISSVQVKEFTYTDGVALPHVEIILLDGGMSSTGVGFFAPLSDKDMTGLTVNERTPASLVTVNSHAFSASSEDPMEIPRYTEICACVIKTYINSVENKDDSYIPICEKQCGQFLLGVSVQQEGYDDGLPSNNEEFQQAITEGKAFPIKITTKGNPKTGINRSYWDGKVSIDDQDPIEIEHDNVVGFVIVIVTSGTSTFNRKVRPTPPYDELTDTWDFGRGIPLGIDYYVILKQPIDTEG